MEPATDNARTTIGHRGTTPMVQRACNGVYNPPIGGVVPLHAHHRATGVHRDQRSARRDPSKVERAACRAATVRSNADLGAAADGRRFRVCELAALRVRMGRLARSAGAGRVGADAALQNRIRLLPSSRELQRMEVAICWPAEYLAQLVDLLRAVNAVALGALARSRCRMDRSKARRLCRHMARAARSGLQHHRERSARLPDAGVLGRVHIDRA